MFKENLIKINNIAQRASLKTILLVSLVVAPFISLASVQQAHAAWGCSAGQVCIYDRINGEGRAIAFNTGNSSYCFDLIGTANDMADSYYNRGQRSVSFYKHANCTGDILQYGNQPIPSGFSGNFPAICQDAPESCRNKASSVLVHTAPRPS